MNNVMTYIFASVLVAIPLSAHALEVSVCSLYQASRGDQVYKAAAKTGERSMRYWVVVQVARNENWFQGNGDLGRVGTSSKEREIVVEERPGTFPAFFYILGFSEEYYGTIVERTSTGDWTQWLVTEEDESNVLFDSRTAEGGEFETSKKGSLTLC